MKRKAPAADGQIYRLRLEVQYLEPLIWREIEVLSSMSLEKLHHAIQVLMGWQDSHLWAFQAGKRRFEPPHDDPFGFGDKPEDPAAVSLEALLRKEKERLLYTYDFGDDWLVTVTLLSIARHESGAQYPCCVGAARAGPLEDSGGPPGYEELLQARNKSRSREAKELLEWAGTDWDPDRFDIEAVNRVLAALPASRRLH